MKKSDINRKNGLLILQWCKTKFGHNLKNKSYPTLILHRGRKYYGEYDEIVNIIHIWKENQVTFISFIDTIIHEFVHYHQSAKPSFYKKRGFSYSTDPLEKEARTKARKFKRECYTTVFIENESN